MSALGDLLSHPLLLAVSLFAGAGGLAVLKKRLSGGNDRDAEPIDRAAPSPAFQAAGRISPRAEPPVPAPAGESIADVLAATPAFSRTAGPMSRRRALETVEDDEPEILQAPKPRRRHRADRLPAGETATAAPETETEIAAEESGTRALLIQAIALSDDVSAGPAALDFARRLARGGRVIFIDIEGETLAPGPGLAELMGGAATFADAIGRDENSRLHLIGRGEDPLEEGGSFELMVEALRETYDFVVLAGEAADDGAVLAAIEEADGAILVRGPDTPESRVLAETEDLRAAGVRDVFVVDADELTTLEAA